MASINNILFYIVGRLWDVVTVAVLLLCLSVRGVTHMIRSYKTILLICRSQDGVCVCGAEVVMVF